MLLNKTLGYISQIRHRQGFFRNVALLAGGTAIGHLVTFVAAPVLTRLYTPQAFGALSVYTSVISIVGVVVALRYELAIPLAEDDRSASHLLFLSLLIVLGTSLALTLILMAGGKSFFRLTDAPSLLDHAWLVLPGLAALGIFKVLQYWAIRKEDFPAIAQSKLSHSVGAAFTQIGLGIAKTGEIGLVIGFVIGQLVGMLNLFFSAKGPARERPKAFSVPGLSEVSRRYARFPIFSSWSGVLNALSVQLPLLVLASLFGASIAGLYSLSGRVLQAPMALVGQAVGQVFYSDAARSNREGRIAALTLSVNRKLLQIGLPILLLMGITAPEVFAILFGSEWRLAGIYAQWLAPWLLLVFVSSPLSTLPFVLHKQKEELAFQAILLIGRVGALALGGLLGNANLAIALFGVVSALCWFWFTLWLMRISGNSISDVIGDIVREALTSIPYTLPAIVTKVIFAGTDGDIYVTVAAGISGLLIAWRFLRLMRARSLGSQDDSRTIA